MSATTAKQLIAFANTDRLAFGPPETVVPVVKNYAEANAEHSILIFNTEDSKPIEIDLRGSIADILASFPPEESAPTSGTNTDVTNRLPGRPKLGVTSREVTLLPRHWEWLSQQTGGASVTLRKLVDEARHSSKEKDALRAAQESTYRFMTAMAGNEVNYEGAVRALYERDIILLRRLIETWPKDIQSHTLYLITGEPDAIFEISNFPPLSELSGKAF